MTSPASPIRLELQGIRKAFPSVVANDGIDLAVAPGSIHALLGENGAGKSTLMKIVYGVMRADAGRILWNGVPAHISSPSDARALGIGMVFQHFSLFPALSVAENIALALPGTRDLPALSSAARATRSASGTTSGSDVVTRHDAEGVGHVRSSSADYEPRSLFHPVVPGRARLVDAPTLCNPLFPHAGGEGEHGRREGPLPSRIRGEGRGEGCRCPRIGPM